MASSVARYLARNLLIINPKSSLAPIKKPTITSNYYTIHTSVEPARTLPPEIDTDYQEVKSFKQFLDEYALGSTAAVSALIKVAGISRKVAQEVVKDFPEFGQLSKVNIIRNYEILLEAGLSNKQIQNHPYMMADRPDNLMIKLVLFNQMKLDINKCVRLFQISSRKISLYIPIIKNDKDVIPEFNNRIEYLASRLEISIEELCKKLCNTPQVFSVSMEQIIKRTNILLDGGMEKKDLKNNFYLYSINYEKFIRRATTAKELKLTFLTPWLMRSPEYNFIDFVRKYQIRMTLEKSYERVNEYAMNLFNCTEEDLESLYRRDPKLRTTNKKILNDTFTLLHDLGYTFEELFINPRCFRCSTSSLRFKYNMWVQSGLGRPPLTIICASNAMFQKWLKERTSNKTDKSELK